MPKGKKSQFKFQISLKQEKFQDENAATAV